MYNYDILVNRTHRLTQQDKPVDLVRCQIPFAPETDDFKRYMRKEAAKAVQKLFQRAQQEGVDLCGVSAYRSFERQEEIYNTSLKNKGLLHTQQYIAQPGASEHQTGLAIDVSGSFMNYQLEPEFGECEEGKWLHVHAPLYGFILRYPKDKEKITGYAYEPWHIRYVTKPLAFYLTKSEKTLEEYYELRERMGTE